MGALLMQPLRDKDGFLRPDMDHREVPCSVMAEYLGIHPTTLRDRLLAGHYPAAGIRRRGRITYWKPRVICAAGA